MSLLNFYFIILRICVLGLIMDLIETHIILNSECLNVVNEDSLETIYEKIKPSQILVFLHKSEDEETHLHLINQTVEKRKKYRFQGVIDRIHHKISIKDEFELRKMMKNFSHDINSHQRTELAQTLAGLCEKNNSNSVTIAKHSTLSLIAKNFSKNPKFKSSDCMKFFNYQPSCQDDDFNFDMEDLQSETIQRQPNKQPMINLSGTCKMNPNQKWEWMYSLIQEKSAESLKGYKLENLLEYCYCSFIY